VPDFRTLKPSSEGVTQAIDGSVCSPAARTGAAFEGFFRAPSDGEYTFYTASDGGAVVFLHDARVIDDDFARTKAEASGTVRLAAGWHPLRVYYRHGEGARRFSIEYTGPGVERRAISGDALALAR
jgi:hypothetical protein